MLLFSYIASQVSYTSVVYWSGQGTSHRHVRSGNEGEGTKKRLVAEKIVAFNSSAAIREFLRV